MLERVWATRLPITPLLVLVLGTTLVLKVSFVAAAPLVPANFDDRLVTRSSYVMDVAFLPDGRMLVARQIGLIDVYRDGVLLRSRALDYSDRVCANQDRGIQSVVADPSFITNSYIYVYYTSNKNGSCADNDALAGPVNRVSRFTFRSDNSIDPLSEVVLVDNIPSMYLHQGGDTAFGKDAYLYVSTGDGGCDYAGDSGCFSQNDASRDQHSLLGKVLRLTVPGGGIPPSNPFQGSNSARCNVGSIDPTRICQETYARGLRNPWRIAMDPNASDTRFFINDVGQGTSEEINLGQSAADYGWNVREGHCATGSQTDCGPAPPGFTNPRYSYDHNTGCTAVTGGAFVPAGAWRRQDDAAYMYADFTCGKIFALTPSGNDYTATEFLTGAGSSSINGITFGPSGSGVALYYTTYASGEIRRVTYTGAANRLPTASAKAIPSYGSLPLDVEFDATASSDADGDPLAYDWDFGDGTPHSSSPTPRHRYRRKATYAAILTVTDDRGGTDQALVRIDAGNNAPTPEIDAPLPENRFRVGETLTLSGYASDQEDGDLSDTDLSWRVLQHHNDHVHPYLPTTTGNGVRITTPPPEDPYSALTSYLEIQLTATDSQGLTRTISQDLLPHLVDLTLQTRPGGMIVRTFGDDVTSPYKFTSWEGWNLSVGASDQPAAGKFWRFVSWSDGGARSHSVVTPPSSTSYTASFQPENFPHVGGGTPYWVRLVPAFARCTTPNSRHAPPLDAQSCSPPVQESASVTTSKVGRGSGTAVLRVTLGDPGTQGDEADLRIVASTNDVKAASTGSDYESELLLDIDLRLTDLSNGPTGLEAGTMTDTSLSAPLQCVATASALRGSSCSLATTADTLLPNVVKEGKRMSLQVLSIGVNDRGPDNDIGDQPGSECPPFCGTGDEEPFVGQGLFFP